MTTERRPRAAGAKNQTTPLELRLYVAALLAVVYAIAWRAIDGPAPAAEPALTNADAIAAAPPAAAPRAVWIDSLPPGQRPVIALPAGWQRASGTSGAPASLTAPPSRLVRAPARSAPRVRTRSS